MTSKNTSPRIAFFGTPYVARDTFAFLYEEGYVPSLVITSPDARRGRGLHFAPSETKEWAEAHTLVVVTPKLFDEHTVKEILAYKAELGIVVAYGKIIPTELIEGFPLGMLNVHYSLLPQYRGASPVETALLHGDTITGVSIQKLAPELDAGDIIAQREVSIKPEETILELRPRLIHIGAELLSDILPDFMAGKIAGTPQNHEKASLAGKIRKEDGLLVYGENHLKNWNKYRAYAESPGTYFFQNGKRIKITGAEYKDGSFVIKRVIPEGKKEMPYADFLRAR